MITRKEYLAHSKFVEGETLPENRARGFKAHRAYYAQFASEGVKGLVISAIGLDRILASKDEHFNDIPLKEWDNLDGSVRRLCSRKIKEAGDFISLSSSVCILKEAARQLKDNALGG